MMYDILAGMAPLSLSLSLAFLLFKNTSRNGKMGKRIFYWPNCTAASRDEKKGKYMPSFNVTK
jgi:hypothetical protein